MEKPSFDTWLGPPSPSWSEEPPSDDSSDQEMENIGFNDNIITQEGNQEMLIQSVATSAQLPNPKKRSSPSSPLALEDLSPTPSKIRCLKGDIVDDLRAQHNAAEALVGAALEAPLDLSLEKLSAVKVHGQKLKLRASVIKEPSPSLPPGTLCHVIRYAVVAKRSRLKTQFAIGSGEWKYSAAEIRNESAKEIHWFVTSATESFSEQLRNIELEIGAGTHESGKSQLTCIAVIAEAYGTPWLVAQSRPYSFAVHSSDAARQNVILHLIHTLDNSNTDDQLGNALNEALSILSENHPKALATDEARKKLKLNSTETLRKALIVKAAHPPPLAIGAHCVWGAFQPSASDIPYPCEPESDDTDETEDANWAILTPLSIEQMNDFANYDEESDCTESYSEVTADEAASAALADPHPLPDKNEKNESAHLFGEKALNYKPDDVSRDDIVDPGYEDTPNGAAIAATLDLFAKVQDQNPIPGYPGEWEELTYPSGDALDAWWRF